MYGDSHVQESYHVAETLKLMTSREYDFVCDNMAPMEAQLFRKRLVETIIHTDMAEMKNLRDKLKTCMDAKGIANGQNSDRLIDTSSPKAIEESKQLVSNAILHASDISTSLRDFDVSAQWADLLFEEFFNQGDTEKALGLEVSMLCDRETTKIAGGQTGFI